jgi:hypothetical protein
MRNSPEHTIIWQEVDCICVLDLFSLFYFPCLEIMIQHRSPNRILHSWKIKVKNYLNFHQVCLSLCLYKSSETLKCVVNPIVSFVGSSQFRVQVGNDNLHYTNVYMHLYMCLEGNLLNIFVKK